MTPRLLAAGLAAVSLAACRRDDPLEQLLAQQQATSVANADAVLQAVAQQPARTDLDLPRPPPVDEAPAAAANTVTGVVTETMDASSYTYVKLRMNDGSEEWAAVPKTPVTTGQTVRIAQSMVMTDFHSQTLNRNFARIIFGNLVGTGEAMAQELPPGHPPVNGASPSSPVAEEHPGWKGAQPSDEPPAQPQAFHGGKPSDEEDGTIIEGVVDESMDASSYTYLRVGEEWAAITKAAVKRGDKVKLRSSVVMHDFHSATLQRSFAKITFATLVE